MLVVFLHTASHMAVVHFRGVCLSRLSLGFVRNWNGSRALSTCSAKYITGPKVVDPNKHDISARHRVCPQANYKFLIDLVALDANEGECNFKIHI